VTSRIRPFALLAVLLALAAPAAAFAQDASPPAGATPDVVLDWIDAWEAADGVYEDVPANHSITGGEIEASLAGYLGHGGAPGGSRAGTVREAAGRTGVGSRAADI